MHSSTFDAVPGAVVVECTRYVLTPTFDDDDASRCHEDMRQLAAVQATCAV